MAKGQHPHHIYFIDLIEERKNIWWFDTEYSLIFFVILQTLKLQSTVPHLSPCIHMNKWTLKKKINSNKNELPKMLDPKLQGGPGQMITIVFFQEISSPLLAPYCFLWCGQIRLIFCLSRFEIIDDIFF